MRRTIALTVALVLTLSLSLFAGGASAEENIDVRIMTRWSDDSPFAVYWREQVKAFNESGRGITIIDESLSDEAAYLDKLRSQIATGTQPEIFIEYGGSRTIDYVEAGILVDVQPYLDADPEWSGSFLNDLYGKWQYEDYPGTFGIPCQFYSVFLYYNKALLAQSGFDGPPENFDEFRTMCQTLLDNGQLPMTLGEKDVWRAGHFFNNLIMKSYGAKAVDDLAARVLKYDGPEMLSLYAIIKEFNDSGFFGPNAVGVDVHTEDSDFLTNKTALRFNGTWFIPQIVAEYEGDIENIGVARFPYINEAYRDSYQGGTAEAYSISKREGKVDASIEVIKYLTSDEFYQGAEAYCEGGVYVKTFESDPSVSIDHLTTDAKALLAEGKEFRDDVQTYDTESHMLDTVRAALQGLFIGNTPEQCGAEIVAKIQNK
jgi:ABC-type glycerol-3-phosphate transport system substrate-binding protein